jgi:ribonuclease E
VTGKERRAGADESVSGTAEERVDEQSDEQMAAADRSDEQRDDAAHDLDRPEGDQHAGADHDERSQAASDEREQDDDDADDDNGDDGAEERPAPEQLGGGDALDDVPERPRYSSRRQYKIQEVIKRRQILLVQVVKEERGNKGAALTTFLSLAGRYSVLMPNTGRGGGISRKITSAEDRRRLKEIATELEVPEGMGIILRTAGASRTRAEITSI